MKPRTCIIVVILVLGLVHQGVALPEEELAVEDKLAGLMCFGSVEFRSHILCTKYDNSLTDKIEIDVEPRPDTLSLNQNLGWLYYSYPNSEMNLAMSRTNLISPNFTQDIVFSMDVPITLFKAGTGYVYTFFTQSTTTNPAYLFFFSGPVIYRSISNGAETTAIYTFTEPDLRFVSAITYSAKLNKLYVVTMYKTITGDAMCELNIMNTDGTNFTVIDGHFDDTPGGEVVKIIVDTSDATPSNPQPKMAYSWFSNDRNTYGLSYYDGKINLKVFSTSKTIYDFAFDPISKSYVFTTYETISKIQIGSNHIRDIKISEFDKQYVYGIVITPSNCPQNCNLNGRCLKTNKSCKCLPNYYTPNCALYCSTDSCIHGTCQNDGTCQCDSDWKGPDCNTRLTPLPIFPQRMILKNVTVLYATTNKVSVVKTLYFDQLLQMVRTDFANGTTVIDRYDNGFSFVVNNRKCDSSLLQPILPQWKLPEDSIYKGKLNCGLSKQCDVWWSQSQQIEYDIVSKTDSVYLPVYKKDLMNQVVTSYDFSKIDVTTPDRSVFDYPNSCL